jgi:hypothetical protein
VSANAADAVALLSALDSGVDDIAVELIADLSSDTLEVMAITFGYMVLHAWHSLAIACEVDPDHYVKGKLALLGAEAAT